jgi:uncharacterized membrane protein SirB2
MIYLLLKQVHVGFALLSISGFVLRWTWVMMRSRWSQHRLTKTAPHIIDTLFLTSGLMLAYTIGQYPFFTGWLTAKVVGLLVYILLGMAAMSGRISRKGKVIAFVAAVSSYAWILSVAMLKSPWGFLVIA